MALWLALAASALVVPIPRATVGGRSADAATMSGIRLKRSESVEWDDFEQNMLGQLGLDERTETDGADAPPAAAKSTADQPPTAPLPKKTTPRSGTEPWGRWSHEGDSIEIELALPAETRGKDLACAVSREGAMCIKCQGEQILVGSIALPVDRAEMAWVIEEQDDGGKLLCLELPLLPIDTSGRSTSVDCIFDDSLRVHGEPCLAPGLSAPSGKA